MPDALRYSQLPEICILQHEQRIVAMLKLRKQDLRGEATTKASPPLAYIHLKKETRNCNCLDVTFPGMFLVSCIQWRETATLIFSFAHPVVVCGASNLEEWYHGASQGRALSASSLLERDRRETKCFWLGPLRNTELLLSSMRRFKKNSMTCWNAVRDTISERHASNSQPASSEPWGSKQEGEIVKVIK